MTTYPDFVDASQPPPNPWVQPPYWAPPPPPPRKSRAGVVVGIIAAVLVLAVIISVTVWLTNRPPATGQITPPDGDAQRAWITVPSATKPKADALIVDIHFDYQCPFCADLENTYASDFETLSDRGDIVLRFHTRTFLDGGLQNDASSRAAIAAACVDYADHSLYAAYHNTIFANQPAEGTGYTDDQLVTQFPAAVGLKGNALATFTACYTGRQTQDFVNAVEANNLAVVLNHLPPNKYLFGGNVPNTDDSGGGCSGVPNGPIGSCSTPDIYVNGTRSGFQDFFNSDWTPVTDNADDLLALLQRIAG